MGFITALVMCVVVKKGRLGARMDEVDEILQNVVR